MYKGLSPYEIVPMPGTHKALQPTRQGARLSATLYAIVTSVVVSELRYIDSFISRFVNDTMFIIYSSGPIAG
jgi:hypothetical protein